MAATTDNNNSSSSNSLPPTATLTHRSLLSSTPRRGCEFFPHLVGEESGKRSYNARDPQVHHMWTSGIINKKNIYTFFHFFFFCVCVYSTSPKPHSRSTFLLTS